MYMLIEWIELIIYQISSGPKTCMRYTYHGKEFRMLWIMNSYAQLTSEELKEMIWNKLNTDQGAKEVQRHVNGKDVLRPDNTCSDMSTVLRIINNELELGVLMRQSGCWLYILFANDQMTMSPATSIQFHAGPWLCVCQTRFGTSSSSWGDGFWMRICQLHWRWLKLALERLSPR